MFFRLVFNFKRTDLCHYCETSLKLKNELSEMKKAEYLDEEKENNIIEKIKCIDYHYEIALRQKEIYNAYRTNPEMLTEDQILIDIDYKQKIYYGKISPRQITSEFYSYGSCSCLGFGIYYVDSRFNNTTKQIERFVNCYNINILCDDTSQTAADFINAFRHLRNLDLFKKIEKKKIHYFYRYSQTISMRGSLPLFVSRVI